MSILALSGRAANLYGAFACAAMMAYALYAQYVLELFPCPLCVFQRIAVITLGIIFLIAALQNPSGKGRWLYGALAVLAAGTGLAIAARHVWLQNLPADQVPACGTGLNYMLDTLPLGQVIGRVLSSSGECAEVTWRFVGLSMPMWVAIACAVLGLWAIFANFILGRRAA